MIYQRIPSSRTFGFYDFYGPIVPAEQKTYNDRYVEISSFMDLKKKKKEEKYSAFRSRTVIVITTNGSKIKLYFFFFGFAIAYLKTHDFLIKDYGKKVIFYHSYD